MTNTEDITNLRDQVAAAEAALNNAALANAVADNQMHAAGCTPEAIKVARAVRYKLSAAKANLTKAQNALWFAENQTK